MLVPGVDRAAEAQAARELGRLVREDVAVHVLGDDHVETHRVAQEEGGHGVDDDLFELNLGKVPRDLAHFAQIQPVGDPENVRLVHGGDLPAARHGSLESAPRDALTAFRRDAAHRERHVLGRHKLSEPHVHVAVGIEAFGILAVDHQIDGLAGEPDSEPRSRRTDVGVEIELGAELCRRVDPAFFARRVLVSRERPENHAHREARRFHHTGGERRAFLLQRREADFLVLPLEPQLEEDIGAIENRQRRRRDLGPDAVAPQDKDFHCAGILASLTSLAYICRSLLISAAKSSGVPVTISLPPCVAMRSWTSAERIALTSSALRRSTIALGVPAGASTPCHCEMSKFLMPASCMVGTSGRLEARLPLDTANARNFPARICGTEVMTVSNMKVSWPPSRSASAGALPL